MFDYFSKTKVINLKEFTLDNTNHIVRNRFIFLLDHQDVCKYYQHSFNEHESVRVKTVYAIIFANNTR